LNERPAPSATAPPSRSQAEQAAAAALSEDETARVVWMLNRVIDALQQAKDQP
jgi:hypothetical protein